MQWCLAYLAGAWVLLQVIDFVAENLGWPAQVSRVSLALAGVGFLIVVVLAWYHGEQGRQRVTIPETLIIGSLLLFGVIAAASMWSGPATAGAANAVRDSLPAAEERSLAVLPFANLSEEKTNEYFSDGITEEILNTVARLPGLRVASRTSSFSFKGQNVGLDQIAQRLRVAHVLEGSVRKFGQRVVISANLIDTRTDRQIWKSDFDRSLEDVFAVQQEIARAIAQAMELQFGSTDSTIPTQSSSAHNSYLLGLDQWHRRTRGGMTQSVHHFKAAVAQDSAYADAWAGLALAYAVLPVYDQRASEVESARLSVDAARRALALNPSLAHPHSAMGWVMSLYEYRWEAGVSELRRAVALNPNDATSHSWLGSVLARMGMTKEAISHADHAVRLDPLSLSVRQQRAIIFYQAGMVDPAFEELKVAHSIEPDNQIVSSYLTRFYLTRALYDSATSALRRITVLSEYPNPNESVAFVDAVRTRQPDVAGSVLTNWSKAGVLPDTHLAALYELAGDRAGALRALRRAFESRELNVSILNVDPGFSALRSDPNAVELLRRMNLR